VTHLVTGAAGFLGRHVVDELLRADMRPRVLVQSATDAAALSRDDVDVFIGDIQDRTVLLDAVRGAECVVHCAARTGPWGPAREYQSTNVEALETLANVAMAVGVQRIVHVSSITVHGNDIHGTADETAPYRVESNPYSRSKVAGERLLRRLVDTDGLPVTIVRPGYLYGPGDLAGFARLATRIRDGHMVVIGSGDNHIPLIHVRDAAHGVLCAVTAPSAVGSAFLLVNDEPVTQRDYLDAIAAQLGVPAPSRHVPYQLALMIGRGLELGARLLRRVEPPPLMQYGVRVLGGENRFVIERARRELGFVPRTDLAAGVRESVEWFEAMDRRVPAGRR